MSDTVEPFVECDDAELRAVTGDPALVHFAAMLLRLGVRECSQTLEDAHYKPGTPRNDLFQLRLIQWEGLLWALITIPIAEREFMDRAAAANGLRVANGVPTMISRDGIAKFPANGPRVFTLENVSGHPVYGRKKREAT
jgi:hypothetical protein